MADSDTQVLTVKVPDVGEGIAEVELVSWSVSEGQTVTRDQIVAEVMTDKATVEEEDIEPILHYFTAKLPPKTREVFLLSRKSGLTYNEIAAELEISAKTVENQMGRALRIMRELLKENEFLALLLFLKL